MLVSKAAHRYAIALLAITKEDGTTDKVLEDMNLIEQTIKENRDLFLVLKSPIIKIDDKLAVLEQIFNGHVQKITSQLIKLISRKKRESILHEVAQAFIQAYNVDSGIVEVEVMSATKLNDKRVKELRSALEKKLDKTVELALSTDESLKGGISVKIGDTIIDGTVKHKLQQLEETLMANA